ncbi:MAG: chromosome segregation SMC family protein, partial [Treponemataceae bacterium]
MFLKSLDIFGFKSFADRTRIEFSDGITALLGPNGCGKSNVVDAVKWVLGEQAAKTMRAEKMEDIIFNGTETRKALNVAEVTLTISNEQSLLPIDLSEITIRRRLYRSGESEYYINGQQTKLKDVRELFWDTGVGKAAYSVMEQGKIDQILSSKPEDRRYLFEEAAGITRFKAKRAEAERKLQKTEENMKQVEGILGEVRRKYESLKVQADKTISYRALKEEVFHYELDIHLLKLKNFMQSKDRKAEDLERLSKERDEAQNEINEINNFLSSNMDEMNSLQLQTVEIQKKMITLQAEQNSKKEMLKVLSAREHEIKQKIATLEGRKQNLESKIENMQEDIDDQENSARDLNKLLIEVQKNIQNFEENIKLAGNQITENDNQISRIESFIGTLETDREQLEIELEQLTENIVTELDSKLKSAGYSSTEHKKAHEELEKTFSLIKILVSGRKNIFSDYSKLTLSSEDEIKKLTSTAQNSFEELETLVEQLSVAIENYTNATPSFIDEFLQPEGIITKKRSVDEKIQNNKNQASEKRDQIIELKKTNAQLAEKISEYRSTLEDLRINRVQIDSQLKAIESHIHVIRRELTSQEAALKETENDLYNEAKRLEDVTEQTVDIEGEIASIDYEGQRLVTEVDKLEKIIANRNTDVSSKQQKLRAKNEHVQKLQMQYEKYNLDIATSETEIKNIKENFREAHSRDLLEFEERMFELNANAGELREQAAQKKAELKNLGSVNFMAPEE